MSTEYGHPFFINDKTEPIYPPFDRLKPYPKWLVINVYGGYNLVNGRLIAYTNSNQEAATLRLKAVVRSHGYHWVTSLHTAEQAGENVAVQFEIRPVKNAVGYYELDIVCEWSDSSGNHPEIISLVGCDLQGLERGVDTLIQII